MRILWHAQLSIIRRSSVMRPHPRLVHIHYSTEGRCQVRRSTEAGAAAGQRYVRRALNERLRAARPAVLRDLAAPGGAKAAIATLRFTAQLPASRLHYGVS